MATYDSIATFGEDFGAASQAVAETEEAVRAAELALNEARSYLQAKLQVTKAFESAMVKETSNAELNKLSNKLAMVGSRNDNVLLS